MTMLKLYHFYVGQSPYQRLPRYAILAYDFHRHTFLYCMIITVHLLSTHSASYR